MRSRVYTCCRVTPCLRVVCALALHTRVIKQSSYRLRAVNGRQRSGRPFLFLPDSVILVKYEVEKRVLYGVQTILTGMSAIPP